MRKHLRILPIFFLIFAVFIAGCDSYGFSYQANVIPVVISVSSSGEVNVGLAPSLSTPIGTFTLTGETTVMSLRDIADKRLLIIRVDQQATVYTLDDGKEFKVEFNDKEKLYSQVNLVYETDGDIVLELESVNSSNSALLPTTAPLATSISIEPTQVTVLNPPPLPSNYISLGSSLQGRINSQKSGNQVYSHLITGKIRYTRISVDDDLEKIELVCTDSVTDISSLFSRIPKPEGDIFPNFESQPIDIFGNCRIDFTVTNSLGGGTGITVYADVVR